jgi:hypothetical protein
VTWVTLAGMTEPAGDPLTGVLIFALVAVVPTALIWLALRAPRIAGDAGALRCPDPVPQGPPVERLAADLRRVRGALGSLPDGVSNVRRRGVVAAYDDLLVLACRAVAVDHCLTELPDGMERELERVRVELALRSAGLMIR